MDKIIIRRAQPMNGTAIGTSVLINNDVYANLLKISTQTGYTVKCLVNHLLRITLDNVEVQD